MTLKVDRDLNSQIASQGAGLAFQSPVTPASRLHRPGYLPIIGTDAIVKWIGEHATAATAKDGAADAAAAGDLGYTYGTFDISAPTPIAGAYVRLWNRDTSGRWWMMVDVAQPDRP